MKHVMLAVPTAILLSAAALAQTDTTTTTGTDAVTGAATGAAAETTGETFGTNWPLSVETTFFTDADSATLRASEDLTTGWQSLSEDDRTMIRTDCQVFLAAHGDGAADAAADASASDGTAGADASATGTDASGDASTAADAGSGAAATDTATDATTGGSETVPTVPAGYSMAEMKAICEAVGSL